MRRAFFSSLGGSTYGWKNTHVWLQAAEGIDGILAVEHPTQTKAQILSTKGYFCQTNHVFLFGKVKKKLLKWQGPVMWAQGWRD